MVIVPPKRKRLRCHAIAEYSCAELVAGSILLGSSRSYLAIQTVSSPLAAGRRRRVLLSAKNMFRARQKIVPPRRGFVPAEFEPDPVKLPHGTVEQRQALDLLQFKHNRQWKGSDA